MDTEKLRVFITAIDRGSISAAAEELSYTPSGVSRSIAALEKETGFPLLYRGRYGVQPTEDAKKILPLMREMMLNERRYREMSADILGLQKGSTAIGINYAAHFRKISGLLKRFSEEYPGIEVRTEQGLSSQLCQALQEHRLDFVIATRREGFEFIKLGDDPMAACVPGNHPCVTQGSYPLKRFETDPMIATCPDVDTDYKRALKEHDIVPNVRYTSQNVYATYCMVEAGLGVFMSNRLEMEMYQGSAVLLPTVPPVIQEIGIMHCGLDSMTVSARKLLQLVMEQL